MLPTPALDLVLNVGDPSASGRLALAGSRVVIAGPSSASRRIVLSDSGLCRVRAVRPSLAGARAFDDVDLSISTVRVALGIPGENPYCLTTLDTPFPVAAAQVTSPQSATVDFPATKRITLDPAPYAGFIVVTLDDLAPFDLPFDAEAAQLAALAGPSYFVRKVGASAWEISGTEPGQDVTVTVDPSGLLVPSGLSGEIALNTDALAAAFAAAENPKWLRVTLEVEIDGTKVYQADEVEIARAVLDLSALVPTPLPPSDVAAINAALGGKQPIDADLTAIAGLVTTAWGRALLTLADAGAARTYLSAQPLSSQLTDLAALVTDSYGRGLLTQSDPASVRSYIESTFTNLPDKPDTIAGYGITDFDSLGDARWVQLANLAALGDAHWSPLGHTHSFSSLTDKPDTIAGYGVTDFDSLGDARWVQLANLAALGDARWSPLGHTHSFSSLTDKPDTIAGYGVTDFDSLGDARWVQLANLAALGDARWSPLGHTHSQSEVTGLVTALAGKAADSAVVHLAGGEIITGAKNFSALQTFNSIVSSGLAVNKIGNPGAPTVTPIGNDEGATWSYKIVALLSDGTQSAAGPAGTTTHGDLTLDSTNKISLTWTAVPGAASYDVYRVAVALSPTTTGKIANVATNAYVDTGAAGDGATPPASNVTGQLSVEGAFTGAAGTFSGDLRTAGNFTIGTPVLNAPDPAGFDLGGMHLWIRTAKNEAATGNTGIKIFSADPFVSGAEHYLQGTISLHTTPTASSRGLIVECIEQGTAYRNVYLNPQSGNVGIGTYSATLGEPVAPILLTLQSPVDNVGYIEMLRLEGQTLGSGWARSIAFWGNAGTLEVARITADIGSDGASRHLAFRVAGTDALTLWNDGGIQVGLPSPTAPGAGNIRLTSAVNSTGYNESIRIEGRTIANGWTRGIGFWGNDGSIEVSRIDSYLTGSQRHTRLWAGGVLALTARETGDTVAARYSRAIAVVCAGTPAAAEAGMIYYNAGDTHFYGYNGTTWKQLDN